MWNKKLIYQNFKVEEVVFSAPDLGGSVQF
jgi:hypothetical protein